MILPITSEKTILLNKRALLLLLMGFLLLPWSCRRENAAAAPAVENPLKRYAETITIEELKTHVEYLASDDLEGRHSGTSGAEKAAAYIADHFERLALEGISSETNIFRQKFMMVEREPGTCYLESEFGRVENWDEFMEIHSDFAGEKETEMVFAGYGRDSDWEGLSAKGKLTAFFMGTPEVDEMSNDFERTKMEAARERGAVGTLLIVHDDPPFLDYIHKVAPYINKTRHYLFKESDEALQAERKIVMASSGAAKLLGIGPDEWKAAKEALKNGKATSGRWQVPIRMVTAFEDKGTLPGENVLGYIEGTDDNQECVILTAHYDHLGKSGSGVYNGAYDNAAGVAALIEIAGALSAAVQDGQRPRRSVIFLTPDAEELGGIGSKHYLEHPIFDASKTVVDINIDGIGREDAERPGLQNYVHLYLSRNGKSDLNRAKEAAAAALSSKLRLERRDDYGGSDNTFFEEKRIPAVAFSTGHPKDHHQPTDTADKLDLKNIRAIARLAFGVAWEIANAEKPIRRIIAE